MKKFAVVIMMVLAATVACSNSTEPPIEIKATSKAGEAAQQFDGSVVRVDFDNAISHVLGDDTHVIAQPRAVLIRDKDHESRLTIMFPNAVDKENIKKAFPRKAICKSECVVSSIEDYSFRVVYGSDQGIQPAFLPDDSFRNAVPRLPVNVLNENAQLKVPDKEDFSVFFDFNGGILFARPCENMLKFKGDTKPYPAADFVTLSGTTPTRARLEYTTNGYDWSKLEFTQSNLVWLVFDNAPKSGHEHKSHYHLHKKVGKTTAPGLPEPPFPIVEDDPPACFPTPLERGVTVACGNTQWP